MLEPTNETSALSAKITRPPVTTDNLNSRNGESNRNFLIPSDWAEPDDEIRRMFGQYSHYANWNESDNRKGRVPWDKISEGLALVTRGRNACNLTGNSNMDDWEPGDFDGVLMPTGKGVGRVILKPDQDNAVYHAKVDDPNYAEVEDAKFRRAHRAAHKPSKSRTSLQHALAEARKLERRYEQRHEGDIPNSEHADLCGDLAHQFRCLVSCLENVPDGPKEKVLRALLSEMRKGYGIKGHTMSTGNNMISMQAHNDVMHGICRGAVTLLEQLLELISNGSNGSTPHD
jgi:hypothetical protein